MSFNYFDDTVENYNYNDYFYRNEKKALLINYKENIINNPIYKILKSKLIQINYNESGFHYLFHSSDYWKDYYNQTYYNNNKVKYEIILNQFYYDTKGFEPICGVCPLCFYQPVCYYALYHDYSFPSSSNWCTPIIRNTFIQCDYVLSQYNKLLVNDREKEKDKLNFINYYANAFFYIYQGLSFYNEYDYINNLIDFRKFPIIKPIKF